jgi:hypothetical protein
LNPLNLVTDKDETQHWNLPGSKRKEKKNQPVSIVKQRKLKTKKKKKKRKKKNSKNSNSTSTIGFSNTTCKGEYG